MTLTEDQRRKIEQNRLKAIDKRQKTFEQRTQTLKSATQDDKKLPTTKIFKMHKNDKPESHMR